ncbi:MAG: EpsG family protein [Rhodobacterales bacterium]
MLYFGLLNGLFMLSYALRGAIRQRRTVYWMVLLFLFVFSGFRWAVGCDWSGYWNQFHLAGGMEGVSVFETRDGLWWWILTRLQDWGLAYPWTNVVSSAVFFTGVHLLARRQIDALAFLILLFPVLIINMPMSGIRQGAAIGVMCVAYVAFIDHRPFRFVAFTFLASLFHSSALVFLLLAPIAQGNYKFQRLVLASLLAVPGMVLLLGSEGAEHASSRYLNSGVDAFGGIFRAILLGLTGAYFLIFLRRGWRQAFPNDYGLAHIGALMMLAMPALVLVSSVIGDRLGYYLIPIQAIIFARLPWLPIPSSRQLHVMMPYVALLVFFAVWALLSRHFQQCYLPYSSWITGMPPEAHLIPGAALLGQ